MVQCINIVNSSTALLNCPPCDRAHPFALGLVIGMWIGLMVFLLWYKIYISEIPRTPRDEL